MHHLRQKTDDRIGGSTSNACRLLGSRLCHRADEVSNKPSDVGIKKLAPTYRRGIMKSIQHGAFAMPLQRGEVQGYDFNRMIVEFTMLDQGKAISCAISTAAMDDLEGRRDVKPDRRVDQFLRLRDLIEERASRKFYEEHAQPGRPLVLRSDDFLK
jgi:hypothetical protein